MDRHRRVGVVLAKDGRRRAVGREQVGVHAIERRGVGLVRLEDRHRPPGKGRVRHGDIGFEWIDVDRLPGQPRQDGIGDAELLAHLLPRVLRPCLPAIDPNGDVPLSDGRAHGLKGIEERLRGHGGHPEEDRQTFPALTPREQPGNHQQRNKLGEHRRSPKRGGRDRTCRARGMRCTLGRATAMARHGRDRDVCWVSASLDPTYRGRRI